MLKEELKADAAEDKAALVARNQKLAVRLRGAVGESTGSPALVAKNLGIDGGQRKKNVDQKNYQETPVQSSKSGLEVEGVEESGADEDE